MFGCGLIFLLLVGGEEERCVGLLKMKVEVRKRKRKEIKWEIGN